MQLTGRHGSFFGEIYTSENVTFAVVEKPTENSDSELEQVIVGVFMIRVCVLDANVDLSV